MKLPKIKQLIAQNCVLYCPELCYLHKYAEFLGNRRMGK